MQHVILACLCLATALPAIHAASGQGTSRRDLLSSPASKNSSGGRSIFDAATQSGGTKGSVAPATGRNTATASPFGTTSPTTKKSSGRRWKTTSKLADCLREKAVPSNTNISFSGTVTGIVTDGRYTIVTMFDSVSVTAENGATGDVPVTFTVVMDAEVAADASLKENSKKSFTVDSNYVYFVWDDTGCTVRAVDNSLTEQDQLPASTTGKKR
jgi:hypothetical protein